MCHENGVGLDGPHFFDIYWIFTKDGEVFMYPFISSINSKIPDNIFIHCHSTKWVQLCLGGLSLLSKSQQQNQFLGSWAMYEGQCMRGNVWGSFLFCLVSQTSCRIPSLGKIFNADKAWKILTLSIQGVSKSVMGWFFNDSLKNVIKLDSEKKKIYIL